MKVAVALSMALGVAGGQNSSIRQYDWANFEKVYKNSEVTEFSAFTL